MRSARAGNELAGGVEVDGNGVADAQQQDTGVFHPPAGIGNVEISGELPGAAGESDVGGGGKLVLAPVNAEHAVDLDMGGLSERDGSLDAVGDKGNLRIFLALEDIIVHFVVAAGVAAVAAGGIDDKFAGDLPGGRIEVDLTARRGELAVNGMQGIGQGEL